MDEFYWENRPQYLAALDEVRGRGEDLTAWLEYYAEGLLRPLMKVGLVKRVGTLKTGRYVLTGPGQS